MGEAAHWLGLVPLVWLALRRSRSRRHWWVAGVFGISWLADTLAHVGAWQAISLAYPLGQAALIVALFRSAEELTASLAVLTLIGLTALAGLPHPDVLLRTVAWGLILRCVWPLPHDALRGSLLVTFGLGLVAWYGFVAWPGWTSWGLYQGTRLAGTVLFCRATGGDDG